MRHASKASIVGLAICLLLGAIGVSVSRRDMDSRRKGPEDASGGGDSREGGKARLEPRPTESRRRVGPPKVELEAGSDRTEKKAHVEMLLARFPGLTNRLSVNDVGAYLSQRGRSGGSLVAAYRATGDESLLLEAMKTHPEDAQVAMTAALRKEASTEERRGWLDRFKKADPENALANYLAALNEIQSGNIDRAIEELNAASSKRRFNDFETKNFKENERLLLSAGATQVEAKTIPLLRETLLASGDLEETEGSVSLSVGLFQQIKALTVQLRNFSQSYNQAGDSRSGEIMIQSAVEMGEKCYESSDNGFRQLVGGASQLIALRAMDPSSAYGTTEETVQERMTQLIAQRKALRSLYERAVPLLGALPDSEWESYSERAAVFGEPAALQWIVGKYDARE